MNVLAGLSRFAAIVFAALFYVPLTLLYFSELLPGGISVPGAIKPHPHILLPALPALLLAAAPRTSSIKKNDVTFGVIFLLEFTTWISSIAYFMFVEILFYTETGIWIVLMKSGAIAVLSLAVALSFLVGSNWVMLALPLYLLAVVASEIVVVQPWSAVYLETAPRVPSTLTGNPEFILQGKMTIRSLPHIWMYALYVLAAAYAFVLRNRKSSEVMEGEHE